jgi:hypothetical protein
MTQKTAYQFDGSGLFQGETEADESPLEPGVYLLPAGCTFVAPPKSVPDGKWPRWTGFNWTFATKPKPAEPKPEDPVVKLRDFLAANPDVAAVLKQGGV